MKTCKHCNHSNSYFRTECYRCGKPLKSFCPSDVTPCSLLPVIWGERTILVDVSPLTVGEFRARATAMLEAHIEWGEIVFPFIKANANVDLPDTAAQDSASKSNSPAVSG